MGYARPFVVPPEPGFPPHRPGQQAPDPPAGRARAGDSTGPPRFSVLRSRVPEDEPPQAPETRESDRWLPAALSAVHPDLDDGLAGEDEQQVLPQDAPAVPLERPGVLGFLRVGGDDGAKFLLGRKKFGVATPCSLARSFQPGSLQQQRQGIRAPAAAPSFPFPVKGERLPGAGAEHPEDRVRVLLQHRADLPWMVFGSPFGGTARPPIRRGRATVPGSGVGAARDRAPPRP